jgi:hypothetical protein
MSTRGRVAVVAQQHIGFEQRRVLILFRSPQPDEFPDRGRALLKTVREAGGVPGEVHLGEERHFDRRVGGARERSMPTRVRAKRF